MAKITGHTIPISLPRRWIADLMALSSGMPLIPIERTINVSKLVNVRRHIKHAPGWAALFVKAFALVAQRRPELRRSLMSYPWSHFWQSDKSIASVTVSREYQCESAVFFYHLHAPENMTLDTIQEHILQAKEMPIEEIKSYARVIRYAKLPKFLRRFIWKFGYHRHGRMRARYFGTFGLSTTAGVGGTLKHFVSPLSTTLSYGPVTSEGELHVTLVFDHRVLDGVAAAEALQEIEATLNGEILDELRESGRSEKRAFAA